MPAYIVDMAKNQSRNVNSTAGKVLRTNTGRASEIMRVKGGASGATFRDSNSGRFLAVAASALKPVTKKASISATQADRAVSHYLETAKK